MHRNVGGTDRIVRGVGAFVLFVVAAVAVAEGRPMLGTILGVASAGLLFNWASGFCGCNALLGVDTTVDADTPQSDRSGSGDEATE